MDKEKVGLFLRFSVLLACKGYLGQGNFNFPCFLYECLILASYLQDNQFFSFLFELVGNQFYDRAAHYFPEALKLLERQIKLAAEMGDKDAELSAYMKAGGAFFALNNYQEDIRCQLKCIELARVLGRKVNEGRAYGNLGRTYARIGEYKKARDCAEKQLEIAKEEGDKYGEAVAYGSLGIVYHSLRKYDEALKYHNLQLVTAIEIGDRNVEGIATSNLGNAYNMMRKFKEALSYHEKHLEIALKIKDKEEEGKAYCNLGNVCDALGKHQEALSYHNKCLDICVKTNDKYVEGTVFFNLGNHHEALGKYEKSINFYEKALHIAEEINIKERVMIALERLGDNYYSLGKYTIATEYYEKLLKVATKTGDKRNEGIAYGRLGDSYQSLGKYGEAFRYYEKSLNLALEEGDKKAEGISYRNLGIIYHDLNKYQEAIKYHEKSLSIAREIQSEEDEGKAYGNLGAGYQAMGKYHEAIVHYKNELASGMNAAENNSRVQHACSGLGMIYELLGNYQEGIYYLKRSLKILKKTGNTRAESADCGNLGIIYNMQGKYYDAISYYERALYIARKLDDKKIQAFMYGNLIDTYFGLGNLHKVMELSQSLLEISLETKDEKAEGLANGNFGRVHLMSGRYQEAIDYFLKYLNISVKISDKKSEGYASGLLCKAYLFLGNIESSLKYLEKRLMLVKEMGDKREEGRAYGDWGDINRLSGKNDEATKMYEQCLHTARDIGDKHGESIAYQKLGESYYSLALSESQNPEKRHLHMNEAERFLKEGIQCYEWILNNLQQDSSKVSIMDTFISTYRTLTAVLIDTNQIEEALFASERGRARALNDLLSLRYGLSKQESLKAEDPKAAHDFQAILFQRDFCVLFFTLQFFEAVYWILADQKPVFFYKHEVLAGTEKVDEIDTFISKIVAKAYDTMNVRETTKCEDRSLRPFDSGSRQVDNKGGNVKEKDENANVNNTRCIPDEDIHGADEINPLETLFEELIAAALNDLREDEIVIIPDGPLNMVPFAALQDPKTGRFLSETKRIRLAPSLTALKALQECPLDYHSQQGALIVGGPDIGEVMFRGDKRSFSSLPFAKIEAKNISKVLGVEPLVGPKATKDVVMRRLRDGLGVIHFATHGNENGEILLAPSVSTTERKVPEEEDYILAVKEVQESGVRAQLVVLSCCHSGRGEIKAEGVVGMSRAFLAAGARAVVASLWAIDDEATKVFMIHFYSHLKRGESASASLQQAMKEMRESNEYCKPNFWAPFFLIGDDVKLSL